MGLKTRFPSVLHSIKLRPKFIYSVLRSSNNKNVKKVEIFRPNETRSGVTLSADGVPVDRYRDWNNALGRHRDEMH